MSIVLKYKFKKCKFADVWPASLEKVFCGKKPATHLHNQNNFSPPQGKSINKYCYFIFNFAGVL